MIWSAFKTEVLNRLQDSSLDSLIPGWYNDLQARVDGRTRWRHLEKHVQRKASAPYSTGTVTVTLGSTTVTGSGTTFPTDIALQMFEGPDGRAYRISAYVSATELTLELAYVGSTAAGGSYEIHYYSLALPSNFDPPRLTSMVVQDGSGSGARLGPVDQDELFDFNPVVVWHTSRPYEYRFEEGRVLFSPSPDQAYLVDLYYNAKPTETDSSTLSSYDLSTDWTTSIQHLLVIGVWARGLQYIENDLFQATMAEFDIRLQEEAAKNNESPGTQWLMRRWDDGRRGVLPAGRLPRHLG